MKYIILNVWVCLLLISCDTSSNQQKQYLKDIGDTVFNTQTDNPNFKFCDSSNILHKRAYVKYTGGHRQFDNDFSIKYKTKAQYNNFSGYIIIRFAVNCKDQIGRVRWEVLSPDFKPTSAPQVLEDDVIRIFKSLTHWKHPIYRGDSYDGYTYTIIKLENGTFIKS